jgi:hypothetical protein
VQRFRHLTKSQAQKSRMADCIVLRVIFFSKCCFLGMLNCCKLHKNRPGSFFALNHLKRLDKLFKAFSDPPLADQSQYKHSHSLKLNLQTHSGAELMQSVSSCHTCRVLLKKEAQRK